MNRLFVLGFVVSLLSACSNDDSYKGTSDPNRKDREMYRNGSILGGRGGIHVFGFGNKNSDKPAIGVNAYLWRAGLEVLSVFPMKTTDPHGGIIETAWYDPEGKDQSRYRVSAYILQPKLTSDALKVTVFKQVKSGGQWKDVPLGLKMANDFEESILERARALRQSKRADS